MENMGSNADSTTASAGESMTTTVTTNTTLASSPTHWQSTFAATNRPTPGARENSRLSNIEILSFTFARFNLRARITMSLDSAYPPGNRNVKSSSHIAIANAIANASPAKTHEPSTRAAHATRPAKRRKSKRLDVRR